MPGGAQHVAFAYSKDGKDRFTTVWPNLNLLDGTKDFSGNWINLDSNKWTDDGTYKDLVVKKRTNAQWQGVYKPLTATIDGAYTFSAYVKGVGTGTTIIRSIWVNGKENLSLRKNWTSAFDWTRDSATLNLNANDVVFARYEISVVGSGSTLWTAGHKWEHGSIATPWMPSFSEVTAEDYPSYIGTYTDNDSNTQSTDPEKYTWKKIE